MTQQTFTNPLPLEIADPYVLQVDGTYYLYGTHTPEAELGVPVYVSHNLVDWQWHGLAFTKTPDTHAQRHFWNPEVIAYGGRYYMFFTGSPNPTGEQPFNVQIYLAVSDSPLGPFTQLRSPLYKPSAPGDEAIDPAILVTGDGNVFLYYALVTTGRNEIWGVQLSQDLLTLQGEPVLCVTPEEPWENHPWEGHRVAEAPFLFIRKGVYYMLYTGNHFLDPDYAVGYATACSPLGPWTKHPGNPILHGSQQITGTGCGVLATSPGGEEMWMIYHTHEKPNAPGRRRLALDRCRFTAQEGHPDALAVSGPTHEPQPIPW